MHAAWHAASAAPFIAAGLPIIGIGCVVPDIAWLPHEIKARRSGSVARYIEALTEGDLTAYRITHSLVFACLVAVADWQLAFGILIHLLLDLPTHGGIMAQMPLYPVRWRWASRFRLARHRDE